MSTLFSNRAVELTCIVPDYGLFVEANGLVVLSNKLGDFSGNCREFFQKSPEEVLPEKKYFPQVRNPHFNGAILNVFEKTGNRRNLLGACGIGRLIMNKVIKEPDQGIVQGMPFMLSVLNKQKSLGEAGNKILRTGDQLIVPAEITGLINLQTPYLLDYPKIPGLLKDTAIDTATYASMCSGLIMLAFHKRGI
jgi:hypothetical protein